MFDCLVCVQMSVISIGNVQIPINTVWWIDRLVYPSVPVPHAFMNPTTQSVHSLATSWFLLKVFAHYVQRHARLELTTEFFTAESAKVLILILQNNIYFVICSVFIRSFSR